MTDFNQQHAASLAGAAAVFLNCVLGGRPDFYLFGQRFVGHGEKLLDYNRRTTRFRIGVALIR
jgi:phospholipase A1